MADREVVEQLTREMVATVSKRVAGPDFAAAVDNYVRHFGDVANEALALAVTRWQETVENPHSLPAVKSLRALMQRAAAQTVRLADLPWVQPAEEFVQAHLKFQDLVNGRKERLRIRHTHDRDSCRECDQMWAGWTQMAEAAASMLPAADPWGGSTRPCRCDGSGMIDTVASRAVVLAIDPNEILAGVREVYPCPVCNRTQFEDWQAEQAARAGAA
jgi:hypothetical protein